jgi:hypothetical protein
LDDNSKNDAGEIQPASTQSHISRQNAESGTKQSEKQMELHTPHTHQHPQQTAKQMAPNQSQNAPHKTNKWYTFQQKRIARMDQHLPNT